MSNLFEANHQWSTRPDDERYATLQDLLDATQHHRDSAFTHVVQTADLRVEAGPANMVLVGRAGKQAKVTNYSFGQLSRMVGAPTDYLRRLPMTLAAQNLNHGLKRLSEDTPTANVLFHQNGSLVARAITSMSYDRVWNQQVVKGVMDSIAGTGWRVPPARPARPGQAGTRIATEADILPNQGDFGLAIKVGDEIAPAGLYASDHDMFMFLVNNNNPIFDGQKYLQQGVFIQNSEVGDCSLRIKMFCYDNVCGNHIVWNVADVKDLSFRHVKSQNRQEGATFRRAMEAWKQNVATGFSMDVSAMEKRIKTAREFLFASISDPRENAIDAIASAASEMNCPALTKTNIEKAYGIVESTPRYGAPQSLWGIVNGLTELSQTSAFTDERTDLDVQAGKLLNLLG